MLKRTDEQLSRIVDRLALAVAVIIVIVLPLGYFTQAYRSVAEHAATIAQVKASAITALISGNPELWVFQVQRLEEILGNNPIPLGDEMAIVRDATDHLVISVGNLPPMPAVSRMHTVYDSGREVGRVEIIDSVRDALFGAALMALLGLALGAATYVVLRILPLRALKRATAALHEEKECWKFALEGGGDGVWDRNMQTGEVLHSPRYFEMYGYTAYDPEYSMQDWEGRVHPADLARAKASGNALFEGHATTYTNERRMRCKDGSWKWVLARGMVVSRDAVGRPLRVIGTHTDIDERKQAEEALQKSERRYRMLFEANPQPTWVFDTETLAFLAVNEAAVSHYGYGRDEFMAMTIEHIRPAEDVVRLRDWVQGKDKLPRRAVRTRHVKKSGEIIRVEIVSHLVDFFGRPARLVVATDISERIAAEAARNLLESELRESQKMEAIGTLAGGIAHDFNNILAAILGNVALACKDVGSDHAALVSLEEINKAAARAKNLVQQILAFSRRQPQNLMNQKLQPLVEETLGLLRATLPAGVELAATLGSAPLYVRADATQIQQVLMNLCTNAWHALDGSAGRIAVGLNQVSLTAKAAQRLGALAPGRYACLWVSDNGCGMDKDTQARIFEPFFTTKSVGQGTGLGMAVVHGIIKAHQGAITVESEPGKGTTFEVFLPVVEAPTYAAPPAGPVAPARASGCDRHVLYVDDDEAMVFLVTRLLQDLGYRVSGYERAQAALEAVRANPENFDLVVTDFNMPGLSGLDVARELGRLRPGLPVVITSGYVTEELQAGAQAAGVRQVVYKPNTVEELCQSIQRLLETADA